MSNPNDSIKRPVHGSITPAELRELGLEINEVIDFSSNINPLGMSAYLKDAMANIDISRYPDPDCLELREALAKETGGRQLIDYHRKRFDGTYPSNRARLPWQEQRRRHTIAYIWRIRDGL